MTEAVSTTQKPQDQVYSANRRPTDVELCHQFLANMGRSNPATHDERIVNVSAGYDVIFDANYFLFCRGITYSSAEELIRLAEELGWRASVRNQRVFPQLRSALDDIGPSRRLVEEFLIAADCGLTHIDVIVADAILRAAAGHVCDHVTNHDDLRHFFRSPEVLLKAAHRLGWCADARKIVSNLIGEAHDKIHGAGDLFAMTKKLIQAIRHLDWNPVADIETQELVLH
jgi:hypothetical protein